MSLKKMLFISQFSDKTYDFDTGIPPDLVELAQADKNLRGNTVKHEALPYIDKQTSIQSRCVPSANQTNASIDSIFLEAHKIKQLALHVC